VGKAAGLLPEVLAGTVRSASRFMRTVPHYLPPAAPVAFAHSKWMSSTPKATPEEIESNSVKPKPTFSELDSTAASLSTAPKKLLELPDELYKGKTLNFEKILEYVEQNNLGQEFEELVLNNCVKDLELIAKAHNNRPLLYCVREIRGLSAFLNMRLHPRLVSEHIYDIEATLVNEFMRLGYLNPRGKLASQIKELSDEKFTRAFENIFSYLSKKRDEMG